MSAEGLMTPGILTAMTNNKLVKLMSRGTNTCPPPRPPVTNGFFVDALLELSPDRNYMMLQMVDVLYG